MEKIKRTRTRTGCFTCRHRRIKCDETKPICNRCTKSKPFRHCVYPLSIQEKRESSTVGAASEIHQVSDEMDSDKRSSASEADPESSQADINLSSHCTSDSSIIPSCMPRSFDAIVKCGGASSTVDTETLKIHEITSYPESERNKLHRFLELAIVPRSPKSNPHHKVDSFLSFHQQCIVPGYYFRYDDGQQFCRKVLLDMAQHSTPLQYAVASFSSLLYSDFKDPSAKQFAFIYYAEASQHLRRLLNNFPANTESYLYMLATVLELASIERFITDSAKEFRHLQGAAQILQHFSNPVLQCSTSLGRCLLEWYFHIEAHSCLNYACKSQLPKAWRMEDIRVRRELTHIEYPHLSEEQRKARLVDDLWQETLALVPDLADILSKIRELKDFQGHKLKTSVFQLENDLLDVHFQWKTLSESSSVSQITQVIKINPDLYPYKHSKCCPPPPITPYRFNYPPAGILKLSLLAIHNYILLMLYCPIRDISVRIDTLEDEYKKIEDYAYEICQGYTAVEDEFETDDTVPLIGCLGPLVNVGFICPQELRPWLWHKLAHFDRWGPYVKVMKKNISVFWGLPELLIEGFEFWKARPLENRKISLKIDDIEAAATMRTMNEDEDDLSESLNDESE